MNEAEKLPGRRMTRREAAAGAVLCGVIGAAFYSAALTHSEGALIVVYLTQLPLFAAGLWLGAAAAALAALVAGLILFAVSGVVPALLFAGIDAVPVVLLVRQALLRRHGAAGAAEWYPPGLLIAWLTGLALGGGIVALAVLGGPAALEASLRSALAPLIARVAGEATRAEQGEIVGLLARVTPGVALASWMTMAVINGILAQGVLARFSANWRPSPDFTALSLPGWMPILLAVAAVLATLHDEKARFVGITLLILLSVPFSLEGLAVLHAFARRLARPGAVLACFYVMAGFFGWPILLVAVLGLVESTVGLRRRFAQP
jgi:Predicted membrane protein (DUF2232)